MKLVLAEFTEEHAREICEWKYESEYAVYNYPGWEKISNEKWAVTIEEKRKSEFSAVMDDHNCLCGYIRLINKNEYILIGIGLKPSLCGQGLGNTLMELVKGQCRKLYPGKSIVLEVRSFNERAIRCYSKAGFKITDSYIKDTPVGNGNFLKMELLIDNNFQGI